MSMNSFTSFSDTYTSAFPALHSIPIPPPTISTTRKYNNELGTPTSQSSRPFYHQQQHPLVPPKYPKYLKLTSYADLVHEQYEQAKRQRRRIHYGHHHQQEQQQQQQQQRTTTTTTTDYFTSTPATESILGQQQQQQQLETQHQKEWAVYDTHLLNVDLRLPTAWNCKDKARHIEVDSQGLELKYAGPGKTEAHAASIRSNFPMHPSVGLFYYEVEVISKGDDGYIGIGFCTKENDLERLPGWDADSFGYHGDDGHGFAGSGVGDTYGPSFTTGDIIGCGINFSDGSAFYTKNGTYIGTAFTGINLEKVYYPVVGLRTPGEHVVANFGDEAFLFDVELYIKEKAAMFWKDVLRSQDAISTSSSASSSSNVTHTDNDSAMLVLEHLLHHGYSATAKALVKDHQHYTGKSLHHVGTDKSIKDTKQRQDIRHAVMDGNIEESIRLTDLYYPEALHREGQDIIFELQCGRFVEIMRKYTTHRKLVRERQRRRQRQQQRHSIGNGNNHSHSFYDMGTLEEEQDVDEGIHSKRHRLHHVPTIHTTHSPSIYFSAPQKNHHHEQRRRTSWASIAAKAGPRSSNASNHSNSSDYFLPPTTITTTDNQPHRLDVSTTTSDNNHAMETEVTMSTSTPSSVSTASSGATTPTTTTTPQLPTGSPLNLLTPPPPPAATIGDDDDDDDDDGLSSPTSVSGGDDDDELGHHDTLGVSILKSAMKLGQHLRDEYRSDKRPFIEERLTEIFSLLAYPNVENSPSAPLLDLAHRDSLATKLNIAILESQAKSATSSLERDYQQAILVNKHLAYEGNGKAALLKIDSLDKIGGPFPF